VVEVVVLVALVVLVDLVAVVEDPPQMVKVGRGDLVVVVLQEEVLA
jgi:hypothetical protein